jgi:hypothetical protein
MYWPCKTDAGCYYWGIIQPWRNETTILILPPNKCTGIHYHTYTAVPIALDWHPLCGHPSVGHKWFALSSTVFFICVLKSKCRCICKHTHALTLTRGCQKFSSYGSFHKLFCLSHSLKSSPKVCFSSAFSITAHLSQEFNTCDES